MTFVFLTGLALAIVGVGFAVSLERIRPGCLIVAAIPAGLWALAAAYYLHVFDVPWYFEWRSWRLTDHAIAGVGLSVGLLMGRAAGRATAAPVRRFALGAAMAAAMTGLLLLVVFAKPLLSPLPLDTVQDRWVDGVCLQSTPASCGPSAVATVLRVYGDSVSERELAASARTTQTGTLNWLLARALRERGYEVVFLAPDALEDVSPPAIVGVKVHRVGHFLALLGRDETGRYLIGEPLQGLVTLSEGHFHRQYDLQPFAMEIRPLP